MEKVKKPARTQYFYCNGEGNPHADRPGRYLALSEGATRPVMRWWNGESWQYNRRKKGIPAGFGNRPGDRWAGASELHPSVQQEMRTYKILGIFNPVRSLDAMQKLYPVVNSIHGHHA